MRCCSARSAPSGPSAVRLLLCHNVFDHEANPLKDALTHAVLRRADRFAVQNARGAREVASARPDAPVAVVPHPAEPRAVLPDRDAARGQLGVPLDVPVFLFSGLLRPYKGWDVLLDAFAALRREVPRALLVLAGEPWGEARRLEAWAPAGVRLELRYLPERSADCGSPLRTPSSVRTGMRRAPGSRRTRSRTGGPSSARAWRASRTSSRTGTAASSSRRETRTRSRARWRSSCATGLGPRLAAGAARLRASFGPDDHARRVLALGGVDGLNARGW